MMRWDVDTNDPPFRGMGYKILCDGVEIPRVVAFDTDAGWVKARCNHGGDVHLDPADPGAICMRVLHGKVEIVPPAGEAL